MNHVTKLRSIVMGCLLLTPVTLINRQPAISHASAVNPFETRCGWFSNPTPANIGLYDRDGEWIIGVQGGYQVKGEWAWPIFKPRQWVVTNAGNYGYGCACLELRADHKTHQVLEIKNSRAQPLAACRQDRALKKWQLFGKIL